MQQHQQALEERSAPTRHWIEASALAGQISYDATTNAMPMALSAFCEKSHTKVALSRANHKFYEEAIDVPALGTCLPALLALKVLQ